MRPVSNHGMCSTARVGTKTTHNFVCICWCLLVSCWLFLSGWRSLDSNDVVECFSWDSGWIRGTYSNEFYAGSALVYVVLGQKPSQCTWKLHPKGEKLVFSSHVFGVCKFSVHTKSPLAEGIFSLRMFLKVMQFNDDFWICLDVFSWMSFPWLFLEALPDEAGEAFFVGLGMMLRQQRLEMEKLWTIGT